MSYETNWKITTRIFTVSVCCETCLSFTILIHFSLENQFKYYKFIIRYWEADDADWTIILSLQLYFCLKNFNNWMVNFKIIASCWCQLTDTHYEIIIHIQTRFYLLWAISDLIKVIKTSTSWQIYLLSWN